MSRFQHLWFHLLISIKVFISSAKHFCLEALNPITYTEDPVDRKGEYAVITGGNRGIGWFVVQGLVAAGMKVIIGCRDGKSKEELEEKLHEAGVPVNTVTWIPLDMSSIHSVKAFAEKVVAKGIPISVLINNAGIMFPPYSLTCDGFESQFAVNYLNHCLLTHLLMPQLVATGNKKSGEGRRQFSRIVNVSSSLHSIGWLRLNDLQSRLFYNKYGAYGQSKLAQILFTQVLDGVLRDKNLPVRCYAVHPGAIRSNWYERDQALKIFIAIFGFMFKSEAEGAERVLNTVFAQELEEMGGCYFEYGLPVQPHLSDQTLPTKLHRISNELLQIERFSSF